MNEPILIDARWFGIGGAGRFAANLLEGLNAIRPNHEFVVWGPLSAKSLLWPGAQLVVNRHHPKALYSQREFPGPRRMHASAAFYAHHLRPAWKLARVEVTTVHDTIPFRYPPVPRLGALMRAYISWMARHATVVSTVSEYSKRCLVTDCHISPERIVVVGEAIDRTSAKRVRDKRATSAPDARVVFVGRDAPHKNLDRLVRAFALTDFARSGAVLTLVGLDGRSTARLRNIGTQCRTRLELPGVLPQPELEDVLASATMLVQPSLEEGFGLPVAEAMAAGIPVAVSTGGALPEIVQGAPVAFFDPFDLDAMANAIDRVAKAPETPAVSWPSQAEFARSVLDAIDGALARRS